MDSKHDIPSSDDEAVSQPAAETTDEAASAEAARKANAAAEVTTEKLRNALQTKGEQGKGSLGSLAIDET